MVQRLCVEKKWIPPGLSIEILRYSYTKINRILSNLQTQYTFFGVDFLKIKAHLISGLDKQFSATFFPNPTRNGLQHTSQRRDAPTRPEEPRQRPRHNPPGSLPHADQCRGGADRAQRIPEPPRARHIRDQKGAEPKWRRRVLVSCLRWTAGLQAKAVHHQLELEHASKRSGQCE